MLRPLYPEFKIDPKTGNFELDKHGYKIEHPKAFTVKSLKDYTPEETKEREVYLAREQHVREAQARAVLGPIEKAKQVLGS